MISRNNTCLSIERVGKRCFSKQEFQRSRRFLFRSHSIEYGISTTLDKSGKMSKHNEKYDEAISDFESALSIDPKHTESIILKGNAFLSLGRFQEAGACYESLRSLGGATLADANLKKLHDIQEQV